jgi:hypothetical protein
MPPAGFEPATPASKRPQTHALELATTGDRRKNQLIPNVLLNSYITAPYSAFTQIYAKGIPLVKRTTSQYHRDLANKTHKELSPLLPTKKQIAYKAILKFTGSLVIKCI